MLRIGKMENKSSFRLSFRLDKELANLEVSVAIQSVLRIQDEVNEKTALQLMSNVGGACGLFIGSSVIALTLICLSFVPVVYHFSMIVLKFFIFYTFYGATEERAIYQRVYKETYLKMLSTESGDKEE
ncbi:hypothetical protein Ciccas_013433 [Cichlidogyrus casuarinus]|uniref:Uncharacterized protein n=1 Tax=Cichlidogyrus casuarinus TaxID=1844966 RepID=A0ABD2PKK6_9PLAT